MPKLRIGTLLDDKPVKITAELAATVHRDLVTYADAVARESGQRIEPAKLIGPMLARFMAADRGFTKARRSNASLENAGNDHK